MNQRTVATAICSSLFLCVMLAAGSVIRAESDEPDTQAVTVWLEPGWNFVGWLGQDGPIDGLFEQVGEVVEVYAQAAADTDARTLTWRPVLRGSDRIIRSGEALWIRIEAERSVRWRQDALREMPDLPLRRGQHAVVWAGPGYRSVGAVLGRVSEQLRHALRWDNRTQAFQLYSPEFASHDIWSFQINPGDALLLQLDAPAVWGLPEGPTITGADWLPEADRRLLENTATNVHRYFDRWLGITPLAFELHAQKFPFPCLSGGSQYYLILYLPCPDLERLAGSTMAEKYAAAAVGVTRARGDHDEPEWLIVGHAHYVHARWVAAAGIRPYRTTRAEMIGFTRSTDLALDSEALNDRFTNPDRPLWRSSRLLLQRSIGALAVDWLVSRTSESALGQYARTRFSGDWQAAFEDAFGISFRRFTHWFEQYRTDLVSADSGAPRLSRPFHQIVFFGPLTDDRRAMVEEIEEIVGFFEREYGLVATAATFVLDFDVESYEYALGTVGTHFCGHERDSVVYVLDECAYPFIIAHEFAHLLMTELGSRGPKPQWLVEGAAEYLAMQQSIDASGAKPASAWAGREEFVRGIIEDLPARTSDSELAIAAIDGDEYYKVYILVVRHLVERFGIEKLFEAFSPAWEAGGPDDASRFQAVFGVTLDDFYADFGKWLRSLT